MELDKNLEFFGLAAMASNIRKVSEGNALIQPVAIRQGSDALLQASKSLRKAWQITD
jgi:hypothetical protein